MSEKQPKLLDQLRSKLRIRHYSLETERAYTFWVVRFIRYNNLRHPNEMREPEIERFLSHLASIEKVSASTQSQALSAILFLYREVLGIVLTDQIDSIRARRTTRLPVILSVPEVNRLLSSLSGTELLLVEMLYGTGLRMQELLNLRIKDIDFNQSRIQVVSGKGFKDRLTLLPHTLIDTLKAHIQKVKELHQKDTSIGLGFTFIPNALSRKYHNIGKDFIWQFLFPSNKIFKDATTGNSGRWHIHEDSVARIIKRAAKKAMIDKHVTAHTLRHSFATHLLDLGVNLRIIQNLLGHTSPNTTMVYTHLTTEVFGKAISPLDQRDLQLHNPLLASLHAVQFMSNPSFNSDPTGTTHFHVSRL